MLNEPRVGYVILAVKERVGYARRSVLLQLPAGARRIQVDFILDVCE